MVYVCLDNEGYMNTGGQKSGSTPLMASTSSTPGGNPNRKKDIAQIMAAHNVPYVATATVAYPDDLVRKVAKARDMKGLRFIVVLTPVFRLGHRRRRGDPRFASSRADWRVPALRDRERQALHHQLWQPGCAGGDVPEGAEAVQTPLERGHC